jgi:hypothetical protein
MKKLLLIICVSVYVVIGCSSDKKNKTIKHYEEEILIGKVKEITLNKYVDILENTYTLNAKIIDSLDINGNIIKSDEFKLLDVLDEKSLYLAGRSIYNYDIEKGLKIKSYINEDGNIIEIDTITSINNNEIKILKYVDKKVFNSKQVLKIDSSLKVLSITWYSKDSIKTQTNNQIWGGNNVKIINYIRLGSKEGKIEYKYNKFDVIGNWIERDVIFYDGDRVDFINKEKRSITYYK